MEQDYGFSGLLSSVDLQPTGAKPGPAFFKRFCGLHKPGRGPSGLYSGPFLDSREVLRVTGRWIERTRASGASRRCWGDDYAPAHFARSRSTVTLSWRASGDNASQAGRSINASDDSCPDKLGHPSKDQAERRVDRQRHESGNADHRPT